MATKYDDASYFLDLVSEEIQAYVYGGMILGWMIDNNMVNPEMINESKIDAVQNRERTGPQIYLEIDGVLTPDQFDSRGQEFLNHYMLGDRPAYQSDFGAVFIGKYGSPFQVDDTWENFELLQPKIEASFIAWTKENG